MSDDTNASDDTNSGGLLPHVPGQRQPDATNGVESGTDAVTDPTTDEPADNMAYDLHDEALGETLTFRGQHYPRTRVATLVTSMLSTVNPNAVPGRMVYDNEELDFAYPDLVGELVLCDGLVYYTETVAALVQRHSTWLASDLDIEELHQETPGAEHGERYHAYNLSDPGFEGYIRFGAYDYAQSRVAMLLLETVQPIGPVTEDYIVTPVERPETDFSKPHVVGRVVLFDGMLYNTEELIAQVERQHDWLISDSDDLNIFDQLGQLQALENERLAASQQRRPTDFADGILYVMPLLAAMLMGVVTCICLRNFFVAITAVQVGQVVTSIQGNVISGGSFSFGFPPYAMATIVLIGIMAASWLFTFLLTRVRKNNDMPSSPQHQVMILGLVAITLQLMTLVGMVFAAGVLHL